MQKPINWHHARPKLAAHHMDAFDRGLVSAIALYAKRRFGKTTYLLSDLTPEAIKRGYATGYANMWSKGATPESALVQGMLSLAKPTTLLGKTKKKISLSSLEKVKLSTKVLTGTESSFEAGFKDLSGNAALSALQQAFAAFDKAKQHGLLLIDEAQTLNDRAYKDIAHLLRAELDTRKVKLKVIFTGSSETHLRQLFGREKGPFYNWAPLEALPLLGKEFVEDLTSRANQMTTYPLKLSDTLAAFEKLKRTPEFFRGFLNHYLANPFEGVGGAMSATFSKIYSEQGFESHWETLTPTDRVILQLIAAGRRDLHGSEVRLQIAYLLGLDNEVDRSVPQNSLKRLRQKQILVHAGTGEYRFENETFCDWIEQEHPIH